MVKPDPEGAQGIPQGPEKELRTAMGGGQLVLGASRPLTDPHGRKDATAADGERTGAGRR